MRTAGNTPHSDKAGSRRVSRLGERPEGYRARLNCTYSAGVGTGFIDQRLVAPFSDSFRRMCPKPSALANSDRLAA